MCNLTSHAHACADSGITRLRFWEGSTPVDDWLYLYPGARDRYGFINIHASASACAIEIDIWLSSTPNLIIIAPVPLCLPLVIPTLAFHPAPTFLH